MKKNFILFFLLTISFGLVAQDKPNVANKLQFILIIRSKMDFRVFTKEAIQTNIEHWQAYMSNLAQTGKIAAGYRPGNDGETISSPDKDVKSGSYESKGEVVSSFLVINAANMDEANVIAKQCPVFELGGSVEIRPIINTVN